MSTTTVYTNGDGTKTNWQNSAGNSTNLYTYVDEGTDSPNDADYLQPSATSSLFLLLGDMPSDFSVATSVSISVRFKQTTSKGDFSYLSTFQLVQSDESTALTAAVTASRPTTFTTQTATPTITGNTDKTSWDGARIKLTPFIGSAGLVQVSAIQVTVTYTATSGATLFRRLYGNRSGSRGTIGAYGL